MPVLEFASSRLPGKPLLDLGGRAMICRVVERALKARTINRAIVATDDERVVDASIVPANCRFSCHVNRICVNVVNVSECSVLSET